MHNSGLSCKPVKCQFEKETVKYLGTIVSHGQIAVNPSKIKAISEWPIPWKVHDVQVFLGTMNFWRKFIKNFSLIAQPLHDLTWQGFKFEWTPKCQEAFDKLCEAITSEPILKAPCHNLPYYLKTDSSGFTISGILMQKHDDKLFPIGYYSASLSPAERNYGTPDQEFLAIIKSLTHWQHLLEGTQHMITIHSDNQSLKYFMMNWNVSHHQARWSEYLSHFDFCMEHIQGKRNRADGLSRRPDYLPDGMDNVDQVLLPSSPFINAIINFSSPTFQEQLKFPTPLPADIQAKVDDPSSWWSLIDGLVCDAGECLVVPKEVSLHTEIICLAYSSPYAGHPGMTKMYDLIYWDYVWDSLCRNVTDFVKSCPTCQQTKLYPSKLAGLLQPLPLPNEAWEEITTDLIIKLPLSHGFDAILVVVDRLTKCAHFIPTYTALTASGTAKLFRDHVWLHHGWPKKIITGWGQQFAAKFIIELNRLLGIETALSTAYHPETDGQMEWTNQELEQYLHLYTNFMQDDWSEWLSQAEFAYNNCSHSSTCYSPFFLNYGRHPRTPLTVDKPSSNVPNTNTFMDELTKAHELAQLSLEQTADSMKLYADRKCKNFPKLRAGQMVYLDMKILNTGQPSKKLDVQRTGPFPVLDQIGFVAYKLKLPLSWKIHPVFHVSLLQPAIINEQLHPDIVDDNLCPPPDIVDSQEEYKVKKILNHHGGKCKSQRQFLVKWKEWPDTTWEPRLNLMKHSAEAVLEYEGCVMG
jgi:RNase H-like domain found in reverse transcriptase/Integrase zinc binding domain/Chromo (CHRromatin Organisation MOdifier) domain